LTLGAGQTLRQTDALEVGSLSETITVTETSPLVQTTSTAQIQSIGHGGARDSGLPAEPAERHPARLGCHTFLTKVDVETGRGRLW